MKIGEFDLSDRVMVIAEIGNNHEGSFALAEKMIGAASAAGADAVKFQTFRTELYVSSAANKDRYEKVKSFELTYNEFERLSKTAKAAGLIFLSTPFDMESADFLNSIVPAFKISSGDNNFYPLIEKISSFGKPIMFSSGLANMAELRHTKTLIERIWCDLDKSPGLAVLHCISSYPVEPAEATLGAIVDIKKELGCTVGYSDHTTGIDAAVLAVALGARVIEKHFTIDRNYSDFRDHQLSADPAQLEVMVRKIRLAQEYLGDGKKTIQQSEKKNAPLIRRSIVAKHDIDAGSALSINDITWVRPGGGLSPGQEPLVLGKKLCKAVGAGEMITLDYLILEEV